MQNWGVDDAKYILGEVHLISYSLVSDEKTSQLRSAILIMRESPVAQASPDGFQMEVAGRRKKRMECPWYIVNGPPVKFGPTGRRESKEERRQEVGRGFLGSCCSCRCWK